MVDMDMIARRSTYRRIFRLGWSIRVDRFGISFRPNVPVVCPVRLTVACGLVLFVTIWYVFNFLFSSPDALVRTPHLLFS